MKTLLLCAMLFATAVVLSSCASSDSYPGGDPTLRHAPPAPVTVY